MNNRQLTRVFFALAALVLIIILANCQPGDIVVVTATPQPTIDPTPTDEGPHWSIECLPEGVEPINPNPCPVNYTHHSWDGNTVQEIPAGMGLFIGPNDDGIGTVPDAPYHAGATRLHTYGMIGEFGVTETVEMFANHCYTFNVPVTINLLNSSHWENFIFYSKVHTDDGNVHPLNEHAAVLVEGDHAALAEAYPNRIFWAFQPSENVTVEWEVGFRSVWATSSAGNFIDFEAFYIQDQSNTNICN